MSFVRVREIRTMADAQSVAHTLSEPSKMPGWGYSIPARLCQVGSKLAKQEGTVCSKCYALKGRYVFPKVIKAMELRYWSLRHPLWVEAMVFMIGKRAARVPYFRWHDSGDIQGVWHLRRIVEVATLTSDVRHWLPTREINIVREYQKEYGSFPTNLIVRLSTHRIGERLSTELDLPVSTVDRSSHGQQCEAYKRGGVCGPCRLCWTAADINYPLH